MNQVASEHVLDVLVRRHVFDSERPFLDVLDAIFGGISQPDIEALFGKLAASTSYEQFSSLVWQAQGSAGLIRFMELDLDHAFTLDPQARDRAGRRLVRLIVGRGTARGRGRIHGQGIRARAGVRPGAIPPGRHRHRAAARWPR